MIFRLIFFSIVFSIFSACKKEDTEDQKPVLQNPNSEFDPQLTDQELIIIEEASVNFDDFLDSLFDMNGISYREIFSNPDWQSKMDSIKSLLRTDQNSISNQIKQDINDMLLFGGGLINENTISANIRPENSSEEPAQQAYAYLQVPADERQITSRVKPVFGNNLYKQFKLAGTDCSGFLYFLLKSKGFTNANFTFSQGTFQKKIPGSVLQKYNGAAELINLGDLEPLKLKKGDFMVWPGHGAIIDKAGLNPLAYQSNGTSNPKNQEDHKKNFEFSGPTVKRGISAKDYNWLRKYIGQTINIYRIVPIIDKVEIIKGNNQTGAENQKLPQSLKLKVLDKAGYGIGGLKVIFEVTSGGGQILGETEIETGEDGTAEVYWKLGTQNSGEQIVDVRIKKFDNTYFTDYPIKFNAKIGGACGSLKISVSRDGKKITASAMGGIPPYKFFFQNTGTSQALSENNTFNLVYNGLYAAIVEDANGCRDTIKNCVDDVIINTFEMATSSSASNPDGILTLNYSSSLGLIPEFLYFSSSLNSYLLSGYIITGGNSVGYPNQLDEYCATGNIGGSAPKSSGVTGNIYNRTMKFTFDNVNQSAGSISIKLRLWNHCNGATICNGNPSRKTLYGPEYSFTW